MLEQMERALVEEDPKLASTLRGTSFQRAARRRAVLGGAILVLGIGLLVGAVLASQPVFGVAGFVVMLGGAALAISTAKGVGGKSSSGEVRASGRGNFGVVDGGRSGRRPRQQRDGGAFMQRMEERWRRRRERGF